MIETVLDRHTGAANARGVTTPPADAALVRVGPVLCALPHGPLGAGMSRARRFALRRIVPWRVHTPIPNNPAPMVLGVAPLGDEEGIDRVELVVDLARALGIAGAASRDRRSCILLYSDGDLAVGFVADALLRRVCPEEPWLPVPPERALPFVRGLRSLAPASPAQEMPEAAHEWRLLDIEALIGHVLALLAVPEGVLL